MHSATDIANFLACRHTATLLRAESRNQITRPFFNSPTVDLLRTWGFEHERGYLASLEHEGRTVAQIDGNTPWAESVVATNLAMRSGVDAIYQGAFLEGEWGGRPDFLIRVDAPSALGAWSYEVVETKLARSTKATAVMQLCFYSDLLSRIQQLEPEWMHVVLGGISAPEHFRVQRYSAYFRHVEREFKNAWLLDVDTYPEPTPHCDICSWFSMCDSRWRADDHLSLVAGISGNQRKVLSERGTTTVAALAVLLLPPTPKIERIGKAALVRIREQARLQVEGREQNMPIYELLTDVTEGNGLTSLPCPSPADMFLDLESNPYAFGEGLEYLIGMVTLPEISGGQPVYESLVSLTRSEERKAFEAFIKKVMDRWRETPGMHIYHYAPYEPTAIKRLVGRHGVCIDEVDELLRAGVFVDLYRVVRQGIRASVESYSIKSLEPFYGFTRSVELRDATAALQSFDVAMAVGDTVKIGELLGTVEGYNKDDCLSALKLRDWLEEKRLELESIVGSALPRPIPEPKEASENLTEHLEEVRALVTRLTATLPEDEGTWTDENRARRLLAQMLEWHRREEKSTWWEYFRLCELSDDELQEDKSALGGLLYIGEVGQVKRSTIHRYQFPAQDHALDASSEARDPKTKKSAGGIVAVDELNRTIDLKRGISSGVPHPTALIPYKFISALPLHGSLMRLASYVADHGVGGTGAYQAARDLLLRTPPSALGNLQTRLIGDDRQLTEDGRNLLESLPLRPCVLPIQGPPGSGKTFTGARMIVELVRQGYRVGVTAGSHKVVCTLLDAIFEAAAELNVPVKVVQKANGLDECKHSDVTQVGDDSAVLSALVGGSAQVAAGSAWLWSSEQMARSVDVLFVDEAAQISLANVLALSHAATSLVLLGDPQQLDQPIKGIHPPGADVSALGHVLDGHATIPTDRGVFITETHRLHPDICTFISDIFYEGRLKPRPENSKQRLNTGGPLDGTGLRFVPVKHSGNQNESPEEAERVIQLIANLLQTGTTWTDKHGDTHLLDIEDVLVVTPYNAQVTALTERLPAGARVGTVDKFQGQEAPIVVYSMATSTPEEAPRGMEFLYSMNRLNVAISRARCVAVIVASPALFRVQCKTPRQIELANAFCRYIEMARTV